MNNCNEHISMFVGALIALVIALIMLTSANVKTGRAIIEHGCAEYNQITGDFQWKDSK